jgi:hypothetical protein
MNNENSNLIFFQINTNSIISHKKRTDLNVFLKSHNPDIVLLNETKLNNRHKIYFKNYNLIRNDRPDSTKGGGTGILIKSTHKFTIVPNPKNLKSAECTLINLHLNNNKQIFIASIYKVAQKKSSDVVWLLFFF